jgi:hypothetical protein
MKKALQCGYSVIGAILLSALLMSHAFCADGDVLGEQGCVSGHGPCCNHFLNQWILASSSLGRTGTNRTPISKRKIVVAIMPKQIPYLEVSVVTKPRY